MWTATHHRRSSSSTMASTGAVVLIILAAALVNAAPTSSKHNIHENPQAASESDRVDEYVSELQHLLGQHSTSGLAHTSAIASDESSGSPHRPVGLPNVPTPPPPPSSAGDNVDAAANTTSTTATTVEDGNVATTASSAASRMLEHELERLRQGKHGGEANPSGSAKSVEADSSDEASDEDGADDEDAGDEAGDDRQDDDETVNDDGTDGDADADAVKAPQPKLFHGAARLTFGQNPDPAAIGVPLTTSTTTTTVGPATSAHPTIDVVDEPVAADTTSAAIAPTSRKEKRHSFTKLIQSHSSTTKAKNPELLLMRHGGGQVSSLDIAQYVFWTGDEEGVARAVEEFIRKGLMTRERAIDLLREISMGIEYLESTYSERVAATVDDGGGEISAAHHHDHSAHRQHVSKSSNMLMRRSTRLDKSTTAPTTAATITPTTDPTTTEDPTTPTTTTTTMTSDSATKSDGDHAAFAINWAADDQNNGNTNTLDSDEVETLSNLPVNSKRHHVSNHVVVDNIEDGVDGDANSYAGDSALGHIGISEKVQLADSLYTAYTLEETIYQLAKVMFFQTLSNGSQQGTEAVQRLTAFLDAESVSGRVSPLLQKRILDVLLSALSDCLSEHPNLIPAARGGLGAALDKLPKSHWHTAV